MQQTQSMWRPSRLCSKEAHCNTVRILAILLVAALTVGIVAACGTSDTSGEEAAVPDAAPADDATSDSEGQEAMAEADDGVSPHQAPVFQQMVRDGTLPPLAERLPVEPAVVEPVESIGQYGCTWNTALVGGSDTAWLVRTVSYIHLMAWTPQWDGIEPNAAKDVVVNDSGTYEHTTVEWRATS